MRLSSITADAGNLVLDAPLLPIPDLARISISRLRKISEMAATTMSRIFSNGGAPSRPYSTPSASSSAHTSATVTPTLARAIPRSDSPYMAEPEVDAWCAVCDRLITVARPANEEDAEGNPPANKSKVDENGVPQFIKPMPARIPTKKLKVSRSFSIHFRADMAEQIYMYLSETT